MTITIIQGNAIELLKTLPSNSVELLVTDPPYKLTKGGNSDGKNSKRPKGILSTNKEIMDNIPKFSEWLPDCFRVLKNGSHAYIMSNFKNLFELQSEIVKAGFKISNLLVWEKNNCTPSQFYMKNCEYILFCRKGAAKYINDIGGSKTVHHFDNILGNKIHPTEKPINLMKLYIANSSNKGDMVLDPFMGSGTTGQAAIELNRNFIGFEISEEYFKTAEYRLI